jgi:hypothetical protein
MLKRYLIAISVIELLFVPLVGSAGEMERWTLTPVADFTPSYVLPNQFHSYMTDQNWGKAYELTNAASQASALKQDVTKMQTDLNTAKAYVKENLPTLSKQVTWATQTEIGARKILAGYDCVANTLNLVNIPKKPEITGSDVIPTSGRIGDILGFVQPEKGIQNLVHTYVEKKIDSIWKPINQQIDSVQYVTGHYIPNLQKNIASSSQQYEATRSNFISKTLDAVETVKAGGDPNGVLRYNLQATGTQLSNELLNAPQKSVSQPLVHIQYNNPYTKRTETMIISQETYKVMNDWGQKQYEAQKQLSNMLTKPPRVDANYGSNINTYSPPVISNNSNYKIPSYTPKFETPRFDSSNFKYNNYNFGKIK